MVKKTHDWDELIKKMKQNDRIRSNLIREEVSRDKRISPKYGLKKYPSKQDVEYRKVAVCCRKCGATGKYRNIIRNPDDWYEDLRDIEERKPIRPTAPKKKRKQNIRR